mmetsp:Transcript_11957/g.33654  ORF Transcript_11957/g.33654 Transcript_11957/m.33654 type:complete len:216 (+) Transcript_11957:2228-2875(+)
MVGRAKRKKLLSGSSLRSRRGLSQTRMRGAKDSRRKSSMETSFWAPGVRGSTTATTSSEEEGAGGSAASRAPCLLCRVPTTSARRRLFSSVRMSSRRPRRRRRLEAAITASLARRGVRVGSPGSSSFDFLGLRAVATLPAAWTFAAYMPISWKSSAERPPTRRPWLGTSRPLVTTAAGRARPAWPPAAAASPASESSALPSKRMLQMPLAMAAAA